MSLPNHAANIVRRILRGGSATDAALQSLAAQAIVVVANLLTGVITARMLGPEGRGIFAAVTLWPMTFAFLATAGIWTALPVRLGRAEGAAGPLVGASLALVACTSVAAGLLGAAVIPLLLHDYDATVVLTAQLIMVLVVPNSIHVLLSAAFAATGHYRTHNAFRVVPHVGYLASLCATWLVLSPTWAEAVWAQAFSTVVVAALVVGAASAAFRPTLRRARAAAADLLSFTRRGAAADIMVALAASCDRILLVPLVNATELGYYVVAYSLSRILAMVMPALNGVLLSRLSSLDAPDSKRLHDVAFRLAVVLFAGGFAAGAAAGPQVLVLLYGSEFAPVSTLFVVLLAEAAIGGLCAVTIPFLNAIDRPGLVSRVQLASFVVTVALAVALAPAYGAMGAAAAVLAGTTLRLALLMATLARPLGLMPPRPWLNGADLVYLRDRIAP